MSKFHRGVIYHTLTTLKFIYYGIEKVAKKGEKGKLHTFWKLSHCCKQAMDNASWGFNNVLVSRKHVLQEPN